jgi:putative photosynthetic complex assembly protein 2
VSDTALAIVHVLFLWWFGTGAVLFLDGLPRRTYPWTVAGASLLAVAGMAGIVATRNGDGVLAAHVGFASAIAIWAWNELLFLTGLVTGPRRTRCPDGARGWVHFRAAAQTILWHELLLAASFLAVALAAWGGSNQVALWTFLTLWVMRLSTKLNIFLGVRNLGESFLPDHIAYLASYFRRARMNALFPVSVLASGAVLAWMTVVAADPSTSRADQTGLVIVATLLALAILEHFMLVMPLDPTTLWRWGFRSRSIGAALPLPIRDETQPAPRRATPDPLRR